MSTGPIHFAVPKENARKVFATKSFDDLQSLLFSWRNDPERQQANLNHDFSADWTLWGDKFVGDLKKQEEDAALRFVFFGRNLADGESAHIQLTRPDLTEHVAQALQRIDRQQFAALLNEEAVELLESLTTFFQAAAENRSAVIFNDPNWRQPEP